MSVRNGHGRAAEYRTGTGGGDDVPDEIGLVTYGAAAISGATAAGFAAQGDYDMAAYAGGIAAANAALGKTIRDDSIARGARNVVSHFFDD
ncbi:MAG: hypothetical protein SVU88_01515 [Candidatus Nanohaloarchaea archaeon]|nr:hypothetical protein [Candidatus Nanohaloarchaea archaeon]